MIVSAAPETQCQEPEKEGGGERKREGGLVGNEGRERKREGGLVGNEGRERREESRAESHNSRVPGSHCIHHLNGVLNDPVHMALKLRGRLWGGEAK